MKEKILYLILGVLIGVVVTTGFFMLQGKNQKGPGGFDGKNRPDFTQFEEGELPEGMTEEEFEKMKEMRGKRGQMGNEVSQDTTTTDGEV